MVGIITMKETIKEKATGCSSRISPRKNICSAATSSVASDSAACLSTTSGPHAHAGFGQLIFIVALRARIHRHDSSWPAAAGSGVCAERNWI